MTTPATGPVMVGQPIEIADVHNVARGGLFAQLDAAARTELARTRRHLEAAIANGATIYGVNTGFGALSDRRVALEELQALQCNLLRSHAVGVGPRLPRDVVRALLLLRAHTLAMGASGVSPALADFLLSLLRADLTPVVPSQGSVGASGDLAPLAHLALVVIGEGEVERPDGAIVPARAALESAGLRPFSLGLKEGLSLINGTQVMTAIGALALYDAAELLTAADILGALTLDATLGSTDPYDPRIHAGKPHAGQRASAALIRRLVEGSALHDSHRDCGRVQDAYSLRCTPQVHGAVRGALTYVSAAARVEINSFTDNPLVLPRADEGFDVLSGGNFHGATIAVPLDHMSAALTTLGTISERRLDRLLNPNTSRGLPAFLTERPGLESGFMMAQVTAAALASENKSLSAPASVDTIPTSAGKEDHVSMGPIAARKLRSVVDNVARILAVEAAVAARALDLRHHPTSPTLQRAHAVIREHIAPFTGDRSMSKELERFAEALLTGALRDAVGLPHELARPA